MSNVYQCMLLWLFVSLVRPEHYPGVTDYASLCPHSVCNSTQSENWLREDTTPCCQRCSCARDCYQVGNCCPDTPFIKSNEPEYPCADIAQLLNEERMIEFNFHYIKYRVVNKCPDLISAQDSPACQNPVSLQDYVPVSDMMYERVYRNQHCAVCHGVEEYIFWSLSASCVEIGLASFETFEERDEYIMRNCRIMAFHPEPKMADMSRCYHDSDTVSSCNISGEWNYYDGGLENACRNKKSGYNTVYTYTTQQFIDTTQKFSNVYCLLCNKPKHFRLSHNCVLSDHLEIKGTLAVRFSALIQLWSTDTSRESEQCKSMEIWDPFDAVCRRLLCPKDTMPVFGNCQSSLVYSEGYQMGLVFETTFTIPENLDVIVKSLVDRLIDILGPNFRCGHCNSGFFRYNNETNVYFEVPFYTTKYCSRKYLLAKLHELVHAQTLALELDTFHGSYHIILKTTLREMANEKRSYLYNMRTAGSQFCFQVVQLNTYNIQTCPCVELPDYKWNLSEFKQDRLHGLFENPTITDSKKNTALVCVENYFLLRELTIERRNGCKQLGKNSVSVIILHILVYLSIYK